MTEISLWEVVVIQSVSHVRLFVTPWMATHQAPLSSAISRSLLKFMSIEEVMLSNHLTLCHPFLFLPSIFPSIGAFYNEFLFASGGQKIGASSSTSVLPVNIKGWFPLGLTGLIFLQYKGLSRVFSNTIVQKHQLFGTQLSLWSQLSHLYMTTGKTIALTRWTFVTKVMSLLFNMLSRAPNSLQMVTEAVKLKLKLFFSLEEKLSPTQAAY